MGRSDQQHSGSPELTKEYLEGLKDYWAGRPRTAIEHVSKILADSPDHQNQFQLYRLWIEVLADEGEWSSLKTLGAHLESRAANDSELHDIYFALCGLVHYETDQFEAARLYAEALVDAKNNPYAVELRNFIAQRVEESTSTLWQINSPLVDYMHAQSMTNSFLQCGDKIAAKDTLDRAGKIFPGAPIVDLFMMHEAFESERYGEALRHAVTLHGQFPGHSHYGLYAAFAMIKSERITEATSLLSKLVGVLGETDIDAVSLLGHCFKELYVATGDEHSRERAGYFLTRAEQLLQDAGLCADFVNYEFSVIRDRAFLKAPKDVSEERAPRIWMLKLSHQRFHELKSSIEDEVKYLSHEVSPDAVPGDLCFMVGEDYVKDPDIGNRWRIGAVYRVASESRWHPFEGTHNVLELLNKPTGSIPFEISFLDERREGGVSKTPRMTERRGTFKGVFELDASALDHIAEAIEEYGDMDQSVSRMVDELSKIRRIS